MINVVAKTIVQKLLVPVKKINANALKVDNEIIEFYKTQKSSINKHI